MENVNLENFSPLDKANYLYRSGKQISARFEASAVTKNDAYAIAVADCLNETYRSENIYCAEDLVNYETGEIFDGYGILQNAVNTRLSPAYQKFASQRARKRVKKIIDEYKTVVGQDWRFATFTMPYLRTDIATVLAIESRALELLKKRKTWIDAVDGAFFGEEMTIGSSSTFYNIHYHVHSHVLMLGRYIPQWNLANVWTDCVEKSCLEFGVEFLMRNMTSNRLSVDIRDVRKHAKNEQMEMESALEELCKYTSKGSEFEKVPLEKLTEIFYALSNRQMIKSFGDFNQRKGKNKKVPTSLDTPHTFDGETNKPKFERRKRKVKSLAKLGEEMILQGKRESWLSILRLTMQTRREFRRNYLAMKYRHSTFATLDGKTWSGISRHKLIC
jgi:hypothetical protein